MTSSSNLVNIAPKSGFSNLKSSETRKSELSSYPRLTQESKLSTSNVILPGITPGSVRIVRNPQKQESTASVTSQKNYRTPVITPNLSVMTRPPPKPSINYIGNQHHLPQNIVRLCSLCRQLVGLNRVSGPIRVVSGNLRICPECGLFVHQ